jgi:hypothetical protein
MDRSATDSAASYYQLITIATPAFAASLGSGQQPYPKGDAIPIVEGIPVTPLEAPPPGVPTLAGYELWIPPKSNVFQDGLPVYEVRQACVSARGAGSSGLMICADFRCLIFHP